MSEIVYPQFGRQVWSDGIYTLLLHLRGTAITAAEGTFEDPTYYDYAHFDLLMERLSAQRYGLLPAKESVYMPETPEETATREKEESDRHGHLGEVLHSTEYFHNDQPHPFDLVRCHMALLRPWPGAETCTSVKDLRWRLEVMSWYEDWPVMSTSPKHGAVQVNKVTTVLLRELANAEMPNPRRRDRIKHLLRLGKASYEDYREQRRLKKEANQFSSLVAKGLLPPLHILHVTYRTYSHNKISS
ncbi:hypothetical protein DFP73DRAFT_620865 [Morchella snyderi]|nr:hypothetical protein DFP73DRAFT_620865 [Morchella snyderi]